MTDLTSSAVSRRGLLAGLGVAGVAAFSPFGALGARTAHAAGTSSAFSYGELVPVKDQTTGLPLLMLPKGFEYISYGWTGDLMADGKPTPSMHDGMAAFQHRSAIARDGRGSVNEASDADRLVRIVRNHERNGYTGAFTDPSYDAQATGGTTTLTFDSVNGKWLETVPSLGGTIRNCAGGPTPWGTWLSCEETTNINATTGDRHGYVFEVPSDGSHATGEPIKDMGRFSHEAVCVDPNTGIIYETEDTGNSGIYRYVPNVKDNPAAGGKLQMMAVDKGFGYVTHGDGTGTTYKVSWVDIDSPDYGVGDQSPYQQGSAKGGASFRRGEGAWWGNDRAYFVSTNGGPASAGQVFEYDPKTETMVVLFASPGKATLDAPDNITVSPRGGLVLCEDGSGEEFLHGLTTEGEIFQFAKGNVVIPEGGVQGKSVKPGNYTGSEWCGATFGGVNGDWLFVNLQSPGITFAITGPWQDGAL